MNIIFDLDGTLADIEHRRHFINRASHAKPDWDAFFLACPADRPIAPVVATLLRFIEHGDSIRIWSGRSNAVMIETHEWIEHHVCNLSKLDEIRMRVEGDFTPDDVLKADWLHESKIRGWTPDLVFDDRDKVVKMWRDNGITCAQVAPGDF